MKLLALCMLALLLAACGKAPPAETQQAPPVQETQQEVQADATCAAFADRLQSCTKYACTFTHPLTGDLLQREVQGMSDGVCVYVEQMPNNGKEECRFPQSELQVMAQFYADAQAGRAGTYTIGGESVTNPLEYAASLGQCTISGYTQ